MRLPNTNETLCALLLLAGVTAATVGTPQSAHAGDLNGQGLIKVLGAYRMAIEGYRMEQAEIAAERKAKWAAYRQDVNHMKEAADRSLVQQAYAQSRFPENYKGLMMAMANGKGCHARYNRI